MRRAVLMTRQAISPRLAINIRLNIWLFTCKRRAGSSPPDRGPDRDHYRAPRAAVTILSYSKTKEWQRLIGQFLSHWEPLYAPHSRRSISRFYRPVRGNRLRPEQH